VRRAGIIYIDSSGSCGIGFVRIVDKDQPELHNLHRQVLFTEEDVARRISKAEAAAIHLREANSRVTVEPVVASVGGDNLPELASDLDILVDGTDILPPALSSMNMRSVGACPGCMGA
jgi:adenylyltransferase/sulfurtransferase